jgi:acyl dehydratase
MGTSLPWFMACRSWLARPGPTLFPHYIGESFIAFTELSCKFLEEVHSGDTLYPASEVIDLTPQGDTGVVTTKVTIHNQEGDLVLLGEHKYLLKASGSSNKNI